MVATKFDTDDRLQIAARFDLSVTFVLWCQHLECRAKTQTDVGLYRTIAPKQTAQLAKNGNGEIVTAGKFDFSDTLRVTFVNSDLSNVTELQLPKHNTIENCKPPLTGVDKFFDSTLIAHILQAQR